MLSTHQHSLGLFDASFTTPSATLAGERSEEQPEHIRWDRDTYHWINFYTDQRLREVAMASQDCINIAWLIEPPSLSSNHYSLAYRMHEHFDFVFSFHRSFLSEIPNGVYYPLGGSWIKPDQWGLHTKTREVSLICSEKKRAPGHKIRHAAADMAPLYDINLYGRGYNPVESKITALRPYRYAIVVESIKLDGYFSEKLIDCLSQGTVPIYWGSRKTVESIFDTSGFLFFDTTADLTKIIIELNKRNYADFDEARATNLERARQFQCVEDWLWKDSIRGYEQRI